MVEPSEPRPRKPRPDFEPLAKWSSPSKLEIVDLLEGDGDELVQTESPGARIVVDYVCFDAATGFELESTWEHKKSFQFHLTTLIDCWSEGLLGMKVGGRRVLVSPANKAYGGLGAGHPKSGRALVYLVDLLRVEYT